MEIIDEIEKLIEFGIKKEIISKWDRMEIKNKLMELFGEKEDKERELNIEIPETPIEILEKMADYGYERGMFPENTITYRDLFDTKIMGFMVPSQGEIIRKFEEKKEKEGVEAAVKWFYNLGIDSNYIRMERIKKNIVWEASTEYGNLEITINLSKPEKDPKEIAAAKKIKQSGYPKCLLCKENVGFEGNLNHPARQNLRILPYTLNNEQWFFQYSPYVYYNEHCIVFKESHEPMKLTKETFVRFLDFIDQIPHYFVGSNADLPIVGGSILSHDHFQGGNHSFPMEKGEIETMFIHEKFNGVEAGIVKWPMSVIRIKGENKESVVEAAEFVYEKWKGHWDLENDIYPFSFFGEEKISHNTVTPIARKRDGKYEMDIVLRNNRTTEEYPDGIFHPYKELHHIKKENIGLIEVMGLAVLPGRLVEELAEVSKILEGKRKFEISEIKEDKKIEKHSEWIMEMVEKYGTNNDEIASKEIIEKEIGAKFAEVLTHAGVYKRDNKGKEGFIKFLKSIGFER